MKIKMVKIDGEERVHPETMDLLIRFAEHRDLCDQCTEACKTGSGKYCKTGETFVLDLEKRPDVEFE